MNANEKLQLLRDLQNGIISIKELYQYDIWLERGGIYTSSAKDLTLTREEFDSHCLAFPTQYRIILQIL